MYYEDSHIVKEHQMKIETFQDRFHNDITVRTFYRLVPENPEETETLNLMTSRVRSGEGCLLHSGVEKSPNGGTGPTFWIPWRGYFKEQR